MSVDIKSQTEHKQLNTINIIGDSISVGLMNNWVSNCKIDIKFYVLSGTTVKYWKNKHFRTAKYNFISLGVNDFKQKSLSTEDVFEFEKHLSNQIIWLEHNFIETNFKEEYHQFIKTKDRFSSKEYKSLDGIHLSGKDYKDYSQSLSKSICQIK